jgi:glycerophosphoryl diester phosphodiesterase
MIKNPEPVIFAHRGASAHAPENTLAAFQLAVQHGAGAIELDAKLSSDGEVVVIHDSSVNRTTGGAGKVSEKTLAELRHMMPGPGFRRNLQVNPSLPSLKFSSRSVSSF